MKKILVFGASTSSKSINKQLANFVGNQLKESEFTLIDLNRAGVGLLEIVFAPDLTTPLEASSCLRAIQKLFRHIGVCDGNMQDGSMRCDVNVSVSEHQDALHVPVSSANQSTNDDANATQPPSIHTLIQGNRVEVKNINSINVIQQCIV